MLDSVLKHWDLPIVKNVDYASAVVPTIDSLIDVKTRFVRSAGFYTRCDNYLKEIRRQTGEKLSTNEFWIMVIDNLIQYNLEFQAITNKDRFVSMNTRDFQMAQNLKWLTETKYRGEKIIVWAANEHVAKYAAHPDEQIRMGSYYTRDSVLMKQTYIIGFTSYKGIAGRLGHSKTFAIRKPKPNGFENWINQTYNYSFVDFKANNKQLPTRSETFYLKALGHQTFFKYDWTKVFDGVFYIKEMYSCQ